MSNPQMGINFFFCFVGFCFGYCCRQKCCNNNDVHLRILESLDNDVNQLETRCREQERTFQRRENNYVRQIRELQGPETVAVIPTAPSMANEIYPLSPPSSPIRRTSVVATRIDIENNI